MKRSTLSFFAHTTLAATCALFAGCGEVAELDSTDTEQSAELAVPFDGFDNGNLSGWQSGSDATSSLDLTLVRGKSGRALRLNYRLGSSGWAAAEKTSATGWNWVGHTSLKFWVNARRSGDPIEIQIYDRDDERFSATITPSRTGWTAVDVPLANFTQSGWQPQSAIQNGMLDKNGIKGMAIIPSTRGGAQGSLVIDSLVFETAAPEGGSAGSPNPGVAGDAGSPTADGGVAGDTGSATGDGGVAGDAGSATGDAGGAGASPSAGTLVPLYTYPTDPSWAAIVAAKVAHPSVPVIAVINPYNGPGTGVDAAYTTGIIKLKAVGIKVLGYVATGYTDRAETTVRADINTWRSSYPAVEGIFFDEMSNVAGDEDYYRRQDTYAREKGFTYTVGNPGTDTAPSFVGVVDTIIVYEKTGLGSLASWHADYPPARFGVIPHSVPDLASDYVATTKKMVGFIYITNDVMPNPWDSLPPYFSDLLGELAI